MKRILPIVVVSILVLGGLGAVAVPEPEEDIEPLNTEDWKLVIDIKGGLFGYNVRVKNVGNETVNGSLTINITTDATIMILGEELTLDVVIRLDPDNSEEFKLQSLIGFGPIITNVEGVFSPGGWGFDAEANGFVLLIFPLVRFEPIPIP